MKLVVNNGDSIQGKIGRNDPCACGSGQKYKKCCLPKDEARRPGPISPADAPRVMEDLLKKIGKIVDTKDLSVKDLNKLFVGRTIDDIDAEFQEITGESPKARAEHLFDLVHAERSPIKRIAMTEQALDIYPGLADAWSLLAHEKSRSKEEVLSYLEKAVEAGEKDLGADFFRENKGHFWGMIESRPYMRAKAYLADALVMDGRIGEGIRHLEDCLRLNPNDNQGIRYEILSLYLRDDRLADAENIFKKYKDDGGAQWDYSKALWLFKKHGSKSIKAKNQLERARKANPFVVDLLVGKKKLPNRLPETFVLGSKYEAVIYVSEGHAAWFANPEAVHWLEEHL